VDRGRRRALRVGLVVDVVVFVGGGIGEWC